MLEVVKSLFELLNEKKIRYSVHFRPIVYMEKCFNEKSDLDIFVDSRNSVDIEIAYLQLGFKRTFDTSGLSYNGVEDWFAFDSSSGKVIHLHTHYRVIYGPRFYKAAEFNWSELILNNTNFYSKDFPCIKVGCPELELILLVVKFYFSLSKIQIFKACCLGVNFLEKESNIIDFLSECVESSKYNLIVKEMFPQSNENFGELLMQSILNKKIDSRTFRMLSENVCQNLSDSGISVSLMYAKSFFKSLSYYTNVVFLRLFKNTFSLCKKSLHTEGKIIAFIGCDGSGKSTTSKLIYEWLSWKFNVSTVYLGSGDGYTSFLSTVRKIGGVIVGKHKSNDMGNDRNSESPLKKSKSLKQRIKNTMVFKCINNMDYLNLSKSIKSKMLKINKYRMMGGIIVLDRYPQVQFKGIFDGPKIDEMYKYSSSKEQANLNQAVKVQPDIVIKLIISTECSLKRKPGDPQNLIEQKVKISKELQFPESRVFEVNAEQNYEDEILEIKRIIWNNI